MAATKKPARWREALAAWLAPRMAHDANRYHYLRGQIDHANQYLGIEFPDAGAATRWLLDEDTRHWAPAEATRYWRLRGISDLRNEMRTYRNLKTSEETGLRTKIGQLYQVLLHVLAGGPGSADLIDRQRVLAYAGHITYCDPDFLPWPRNAAKFPARDHDWQWWWSRDEETYSGPHDTREAAIEDARESGEEESVHIMEARKGDIQLARYFDQAGIERYIDDLEEGAFTDYQGDGGEPLTEGISSEQWAALAARLQPVVDDWQRVNGIVITPWAFAATRNGEHVQLSPAEDDRTAKTEGGAA